MSERYTIEDVAAFTGLTDRTLRTRLVERVNREEGQVKFTYSYGVDRRGRGSARVILVGATAVMQRILADT